MKQKYLIKIGEVFFISLLAISVILTIIFYLNTGKVNSDDPYLKQLSDLGPIMDYLVYWTYLLTILAVLFAIGFPAISMISNPKSGIKSLISVGVIAVILFIAYSLGDDTIMDIAGYKGKDNVPSTLKLTDMAIFSMYGMIGISVLALIYAEVSKLLK